MALVQLLSFIYWKNDTHTNCNVNIFGILECIAYEIFENVMKLAPQTYKSKNSSLVRFEFNLLLEICFLKSGCILFSELH